ncbi:phosphoglycerate mutase-like protein [Cerioporus squamosus]|nr:phosphoglycerate mutase-like protein [Cerioporus squamosus]
MAFPARLLLALCAASLVIAKPTSTVHSASSYAGSTVTAVFPPPDATDTFIDTYFPGPEEVGFAGPTPTGDEPFVVETAPVAPKKADVYPLVNPADTDASTQKSSSFNPMQYWGNLSPWWSVGDFFGLKDTSSIVPSGCELTQVHLLHRHGARYPQVGSSHAAFAAKLHAAANSTGFSASGPLDFLNTWTYKLGAELLTPFGREQLFDLGIAFRVKYGHLLNGFTDLPVFRTTSEARMVDSALHFSAGFFGSIAIEDTGFYSSLNPWENCANANNDVAAIGIQAAQNWTAIYLKDAVTRLRKYVTGVELDYASVQAMQELCPYETVALGYSAFCDLFTEEEWKGYEYAIDLALWYSYGPGNPATAAQGIGYVQELVARLTQTPLTDFSTGPVYVDASHDTVISTILVALNFTTMAENGPLPVDHIPKKQTYVGSRIVPFATHLTGQVMSCPAADKSGNKESYIRFILNDGVVPLTGINHCTANKDGLCPVDKFVQGMKERIAEVDYQYDCFANYTVPWPDPIIDGRMKH